MSGGETGKSWGCDPSLRAGPSMPATCHCTPGVAAAAPVAAGRPRTLRSPGTNPDRDPWWETILKGHVTSIGAPLGPDGSGGPLGQLRAGNTWWVCRGATGGDSGGRTQLGWPEERRPQMGRRTAGPTEGGGWRDHRGWRMAGPTWEGQVEAHPPGRWVGRWARVTCIWQNEEQLVLQSEQQEEKPEADISHPVTS